MVDFEFCNVRLNLYQYVAGESHFLYEKVKDMFILKMASKPKKGLLLFHEKGTDLKELCWKQFEFDPYSTRFLPCKFYKRLITKQCMKQ